MKNVLLEQKRQSHKINAVLWKIKLKLCSMS